MNLTLRPAADDVDGYGDGLMVVPGQSPRPLADLDGDDLDRLADSYRPESLPAESATHR